MHIFIGPLIILAKIIDEAIHIDLLPVYKLHPTVYVFFTIFSNSLPPILLIQWFYLWWKKRSDIYSKKILNCRKYITMYGEI